MRARWVAYVFELAAPVGVYVLIRRGVRLDLRARPRGLGGPCDGSDVDRRGESEAEERLVTPASYVSFSHGAMGDACDKNQRATVDRERKSSPLPSGTFSAGSRGRRGSKCPQLLYAQSEPGSRQAGRKRLMHEMPPGTRCRSEGTTQSLGRSAALSHSPVKDGIQMGIYRPGCVRARRGHRDGVAQRMER